MRREGGFLGAPPPLGGREREESGQEKKKKQVGDREGRSPVEASCTYC